MHTGLLDLHPLTALFSVLLVAWLLAQGWLLRRQLRHVAGHADRVPPEFAAIVTPNDHRHAARYTLARGQIGLLHLAFSAAVLLGWTLLGGLDTLNQWVQSLLPAVDGAPGVALGLGYQLALLAAFFLISAVVELPFSLWTTFGLEQRFGFNRTTPALFIADALKGLVVAAVVGLPIAALVLWLMASAGPVWWLWAWGAWMAFNGLLLWAWPTWIAPLFNRFEPLPDGAVKDRVQALLERGGFRSGGLYVMDGSRRSAHGNAYFTGFGSAKRVVFFDTLLDKLDADEIEAVLAHELGHHHHRHLVKRLGWMALASLAGFAVLGWLSQRLWFYAALGVQPSIALPNDALALLLFGLVAPLATFFLGPVFAWASRRDEYQADAYAAAASRPGALASALLKLHRDNASTLTPDPVFTAFFASHPPAVQRLRALAAAVPAAPSPSSKPEPTGARP